MRKMMAIAIIIAIAGFSCEEPAQPESRSLEGTNPHDLKGRRFVLRAYLYANETVTVQLNDSVFYQRSGITDSIEKFGAVLELPNTKVNKIGIVSTFHGKRYLDSTIYVGNYYPEARLYLVVTQPFPLDYQKYIPKPDEPVKPGPIRTWGFLPIDSSVRFINFYID